MEEKEVRLIDANNAHDVLMNIGNHLAEAGNLEMAGSVYYAAEVIENQTTIDPESLRAHGKWNRYKENCLYNDCSVCGYGHCREDNYCPNCGAKMEGGITMSNYCKTCIHNEVCSLTHCDQSIACCDFVSGWISVKDRLPDDSDKIVLVIANGKFGNITLDEAFELACYYKDYGWVLESYPDMENVRVTHWMPLPEPPKEA